MCCQATQAPKKGWWGQTFLPYASTLASLCTQASEELSLGVAYPHIDYERVCSTVSHIRSWIIPRNPFAQYISPPLLDPSLTHVLSSPPPEHISRTTCSTLGAEDRHHLGDSVSTCRTAGVQQRRRRKYVLYWILMGGEMIIFFQAKLFASLRFVIILDR